MATETTAQNIDWEKKRKALEAAGAKTTTLYENQEKKAEKGEIQYTLFASGLRNGRWSEYQAKNETQDLAILFDVVNQHSYTRSFTKTSYAVESKSKASDHLVAQDGKFSFSAIITDSPYFIDKKNYIDRDTNKDDPRSSRRPSKSVEILETIASSRQLVTLVTEDNILTNYVITNLSFERSAEGGSSIAISLELEEFRFVEVSKVVLATADPKKAGNKNKGTKQTAEDGAVSNNETGKRKTPYIGKNAESKERFENARAGTTDFSGEAGKRLPFDPGNLMRK